LRSGFFRDRNDTFHVFLYAPREEKCGGLSRTARMNPTPLSSRQRTGLKGESAEDAAAAGAAEMQRIVDKWKQAA
jgi:hypothetical protein